MGNVDETKPGAGAPEGAGTAAGDTRRKAEATAAAAGRAAWTAGSVCSGIEAASEAWAPLGARFEWFSEIARFPSRVLAARRPDAPNLGDMRSIPGLVRAGEAAAPDVVCGGTPCQAFSLAGARGGLGDERGNLSLKFVEIVDACDEARAAEGKPPTVAFWENVEGVLTDRTNAFGSLISSLAGLPEAARMDKWPRAGFLRGPKRSVAWRVADARWHGLPQRRRRVYLVAGGGGFAPENVLFEAWADGESASAPSYPEGGATFEKDGAAFETFRSYTDCLYASYGTKWNGNAAANNGSLFVVQDGRLRRFTPLECERLMGFPDGHTAIEGAKKTERYAALGNSWAVPVVRWIGARLGAGREASLFDGDGMPTPRHVSPIVPVRSGTLFLFPEGKAERAGAPPLNCSAAPSRPTIGSLEDVVSADAPEDVYVSPVGCRGILRRQEARGANVPDRLREALEAGAARPSGISDILGA